MVTDLVKDDIEMLLDQIEMMIVDIPTSWSKNKRFIGRIKHIHELSERIRVDRNIPVRL